MDVTFYLELQKLPVRQPNLTSAATSYTYSPFSPITVKQLMLLNVVQVCEDWRHFSWWRLILISLNCTVHWRAPGLSDCLPHQSSSLCLAQRNVIYRSPLWSPRRQVLHKGGSEVQTIRSPVICSKLKYHYDRGYQTANSQQYIARRTSANVNFPDILLINYKYYCTLYFYIWCVYSALVHYNYNAAIFNHFNSWLIWYS